MGGAGCRAVRARRLALSAWPSPRAPERKLSERGDSGAMVSTPHRRGRITGSLLDLGSEAVGRRRLVRGLSQPTGRPGKPTPRRAGIPRLSGLADEMARGAARD